MALQGYVAIYEMQGEKQTQIQLWLRGWNSLGIKTRCFCVCRPGNCHRHFCKDAFQFHGWSNSLHFAASPFPSLLPAVQCAWCRDVWLGLYPRCFADLTSSALLSFVLLCFCVALLCLVLLCFALPQLHLSFLITRPDTRHKMRLVCVRK